MDALNDTWTWLQGAMAWPIIQTTDFRISAGSLAALVVLVLLLFWASKRLQRWLSEGPVLRNRLDPGARMVVAAVVRYTVLLVGLLAIVQTVGIDLTTFNVMAGAIGIGVGFGLQNVVSNFIAGIIIMFERPIKIGDRISVQTQQQTVAGTTSGLINSFQYIETGILLSVTPRINSGAISTGSMSMVGVPLISSLTSSPISSTSSRRSPSMPWCSTALW